MNTGLKFAFALLVVVMTEHGLPAQERDYARSMVISRQGIVATSQTLASQAGAQVLARGGNAMDAAIAANAVMGVVEPMSSGMGGDLFAIYYDAKTGKLTGINSSGWAPKGLTIEFLKSKGVTKEMPQLGINSVTVPGCVAGWEALYKRFGGGLPWKELFRPAIYFATNGYPVTEIIQDRWQANAKKLASDPNARPVFLPGGKAPAVGQIFQNPELAHALALVAEGGAAAYYRGEIARAILATEERLGGAMQASDLSEFQPEWVEPISTMYRGWKVYELPPNGQGMAVLEMLNIFERFPIPTYKPQGVEDLHVKIEAQKLAYQDLHKYLADPRFAKVPLEGIISKEYAAKRAALIDLKQARCDVAPGDPLHYGHDTIYLTVVDKDGDIVSLIQSLYESFGSGVMVEGMGFHLQNRGALFEIDPAHPNALAGRKRPFHTIIPGFMEKGSLHMGFGIMGGLNQPQAHAQFVSNVADHGMNIQQALEAPRFTKQNFGGCDVEIESRVEPAVRDALAKMGHQLKVRGKYSGQMGGGQAVIHDSATGVNYGASSPRKDGAAIPEPAPYFK
jgi:gamma-glutamyltranspeptidase/glutathione hydrolase